jgi:hypothetical protein
MAVPGPAPAATNNQTGPFNPLNIAFGGLAGGVGAVIASEIAFTGGMIFGAVYFVVQPLVEMGLGFLGEKEACKTLRVVISMLTAIAAAAGVATLAGFTVTFGSAIVLALSMIVARCALGSLCIGSLCASFGSFTLATRP